MTECRPGSITELGRILAGLQPASALLVTGGESYRRSGASEVVEPLLAQLTVERVAGVVPNPALDQVEEVIEALRRSSPDVVLAVGGGSVIDVTKAARGLAHVADPTEAVRSGTPPDPPAVPPLVAVPTTAGTGSEATHFAVVYIDGVKNSVGHPSFRPEHVVLDPELTRSLPARTTAETGLDALAQAMESMWSTRSNEESLGHARTALELAWTNIEAAAETGAIEHRTAMCRAAHLSGRAIDVSRTTAAHALSYRLTTRYGVAHGHAVALFLGAVLEHNAGVTERDCTDPRGVDFVQARIGEVLRVLDVEDPAGGRRALTSLLERLGLETGLAAVGVGTPAERRALAEHADPVRQETNPRALDPQRLAELIERLA